MVSVEYLGPLPGVALLHATQTQEAETWVHVDVFSIRQSDDVVFLELLVEWKSTVFSTAYYNLGWGSSIYKCVGCSSFSRIDDGVEVMIMVLLMISMTGLMTMTDDVDEDCNGGGGGGGGGYETNY